MTNVLELRLKTMQVRLAQMDDKLDKLARHADAPELTAFPEALGGHLLSELSNW
jgi:hypothetical protein